MRILTWNIQNSGTIDFDNPHIENIRNILREIETINADIVVIQEFQYEYYNSIVRDGLERMNYKCRVCEDDREKTLRNRVLIALKYSFDDCGYPLNIWKYSRRNWNEIMVREPKMAVLGIDVPLAETTDRYGKKKNNRIEKKQFLDALKDKFIEYSKFDFPAIILGDFNLHEEAVYKEYLQMFNLYLKEVTTEDSTWGRYKLDYIFVNSAMLDLIEDSEVFKPHCTSYSDHKYLYIDVIESLGK